MQHERRVFSSIFDRHLTTFRKRITIVTRVTDCNADAQYKHADYRRTQHRPLQLAYAVFPTRQKAGVLFQLAMFIVSGGRSTKYPPINDLRQHPVT